jgi:hypothetical protein
MTFVERWNYVEDLLGLIFPQMPSFRPIFLPKAGVRLLVKYYYQLLSERQGGPLLSRKQTSEKS